MTTTDQLEREYRELARANVELVRERDAALLARDKVACIGFDYQQERDTAQKRGDTYRNRALALLRKCRQLDELYQDQFDEWLGAIASGYDQVIRADRLATELAAVKAHLESERRMVQMQANAAIQASQERDAERDMRINAVRKWAQFRQAARRVAQYCRDLSDGWNECEMDRVGLARERTKYKARAGAAERDLAALRAQVEKWRNLAERQEVDYGEQAKQLAALRAMLERCQYGRDHRCPICGEYERNMHAVDCELRSLLYGGAAPICPACHGTRRVETEEFGRIICPVCKK